MDAVTIRGKSEKQNPIAKPSFISSLLNDYFLQPSLWTSLTYINVVILYFAALTAVAGHTLSYWYALIYVLLLYVFYSWRNAKKEKDRLQIAHRIPFFADALANSLSVGATLEQAFIQSAYYLKGKIKEEFHILILKNVLGKDLGVLLRELDAKFPNTGLRYLISLLEEYRELGVGISPLLKKISVALSVKEEAEEKIRTILAAGSSYARLTIGVFAGIFLAMTYLLKDQVHLLLSPNLKPILLFLIAWTCVGLFIVTRITSMEFTRNFSLRPFIKKFMTKKKLTLDELLYYSGLEWTWGMRLVLLYAPAACGFVCGYLISLYTGDPIHIAIGFFSGAFAFWMISKYILEGLVEDQLIKTIETFPEVLQVFIIGLNSGLNIYMAFQFAQNAVKGSAPKVLSEELCRTKFAMECGEVHSRTWQRLAEMLPFETVIDFCEIMVIAPMHGESIVNSITQMTNSYQTKKLTIIEKKAVALGQLVIPLIVIAFFPLFLFAVFAPLVLKIGVLFNS